MSRTKGTLVGAAIAAGLGFLDALYVKPYGDYVPQTTPGLIAAYIFFMVPWAAVGALIGFLANRKSKPPSSGQPRTLHSRTLIAGTIGAGIGLIAGLSIGLTYSILQPQLEKSGTKSFTQAQIDKAKQATRTFGDEYWACLLNETNKMVQTNISAQDFTLSIKGACVAEKNKYLVPLVDVVAMTNPETEADDKAAIIALANNMIEQVQAAAVTQFVRSRSGR
jgi:hypothetical protein